MSQVGTKKTLRGAALLLCCGALALPVLAQQESTPPQPPPDSQMQEPPQGMHRPGGPERRAEMLQRRLGLNADQTAQVKAIFADGRAKMDALRAGSNGAPPDHKQMRALMEEENGKIRAVLTDDQRTKFDAMEAEHRAEMRERRESAPAGDTAPPPPPPQQ